MILTGPTARVLQLHPTRFCNLECLHCYSSSGPDERGALDPDRATHVVEDAAEEGFNVLSLSGGEPLLYPHLSRVIDVAKARGMRVTLTSNGTVLSTDRVQAIASRVDLVTISIDGAPEHHDRMRAKAGAFAALERGIERLQRASIRFGIIFTLSRDSAPDLPWVARFAVERGAALLQIHPLEEAGRARFRLRGAAPDQELSASAWLAAAALRHRYAGRMLVHVDLTDLAQLAAHEEPELARLADDAGLAQLVSPLVVEADGTVVPLQHGFSRRHALGSIVEERLFRLAREWRRSGYEAFRTACSQARAAMRVPAELPFVNAYQEIARRM